MIVTALTVTDRTRLRRHHERGSHELAAISAILDEALYAHLAFVIDGRPVMIPTLHWREGDRVYVHGSAASRAMRALEESEACLCVTLIDGFVVARSAFSHSANYRSAILYGRFTKINDADEKLRLSAGFVDRVSPGRSALVRLPNAQELKATSFFALPISEASAKTRNGPPKDADEDLDWPAWAGVLPLTSVFGAPIQDPAQLETYPAPGLPDAYQGT